jgi:micrococcal nuclease
VLNVPVSRVNRGTSSAFGSITSVRFAIRVLPVLLGLLLPVSLEAQEVCTIAHVVDGDHFNCRDGRSVRLLLVDAPDAGRFGSIARRALATLVPTGSAVRLETDSIPQDEEGRTLAYVRLPDGRMVNEILVREGFAFYKPSRDNDRYAERLRAAEEAARAEKRGVWGR